MKEKMTTEGQPCRKCNHPITRKIPKRTKLKPGQKYYFNAYMFCENCKEMYMLESEKVMTGQ
jgi:uncharacterized protein with PIN domain